MHKPARKNALVWDITQAELVEYQSSLVAMRRHEADCAEHATSLLERYLEGATVEPGDLVPEVTEVPARGSALSRVREILRRGEMEPRERDRGITVEFTVLKTVKPA